MFRKRFSSFALVLFRIRRHLHHDFRNLSVLGLAERVVRRKRCAGMASSMTSVLRNECLVVVWLESYRASWWLGKTSGWESFRAEHSMSYRGQKERICPLTLYNGTEIDKGGSRRRI